MTARIWAQGVVTHADVLDLQAAGVHILPRLARLLNMPIHMASAEVAAGRVTAACYQEALRAPQ